MPRSRFRVPLAVKATRWARWRLLPALHSLVNQRATGCPNMCRPRNFRSRSRSRSHSRRRMRRQLLCLSRRRHRKPTVQHRCASFAATVADFLLTEPCVVVSQLAAPDLQPPDASGAPPRTAAQPAAARKSPAVSTVQRPFAGSDTQTAKKGSGGRLSTGGSPLRSLPRLGAERP